MTEAQSFELLKTKRKSLRTAVTKRVNELEPELSNSDLNVDRLSELAHLGGSALNTVEGFPISAKAYDEAVELLKNRFANPEILIQAHMNKILSLQPLKNSNDLRSFRKFVDNCNVQLRSLNSLGVSSENYGKILCPMLLKLIPSDLVLDYNKLQQKDSGSDIQKLLSFLTQSLTAREQTYTTNKSSFELCNRRQETKSNFSREPRSYKQQNQKSFHTASELLTAPVTENKDKIKLISIVCFSMTHNSNECEYIINMSLEERKNILLRKGACFNCLKIAKHLSRNCPINKTKCEICSVLHHKFFCFKQLKREIGSTSTDLANQNTGEVFLQTLAVFIENGNSKQLRKISDVWELNSLGIKDPSEKKSKLELQDLALKHFENTVLRDDEGRLIDYEQVFVDWEKEGIIEKIAQDEPKIGGKFHYLPHRPVFKENSTTKIRPVFDGSAHHGKSCSLNDCVEKGPNLIEMIPAILNRFRLGKIGVISDIRKAFLQISLHENDMNFLRFLWWEGGNSEKAVIYRHCRVVFEVSCSPFFLAAVLNHHFNQAPEHLEKAAEKLIDSMFVDNCVASVNSSEELESFQKRFHRIVSIG
ncbi:DUF5641 domain-containing protein [Trichonephila clavipes]|uniref:DUF5641 domain-containing protein n=1 Tax=Trichonephila clavipes TaxID=2585209 RepID=A0A8X6RFZ0_TRICX|nr:DUF5641 domain-containing protein [Trichonephila clavipes]